MKKKIIILVIICMLIILISIVFWRNDTENKEKAYGYIKTFFASEGMVAITDEQVKYIDPISGQVYMLCSIPNCLHNKENENCEANIEAQYGLIYDGKVYYFVRNFLETEIWVKELSGSGKSKFVTIPYKTKLRDSILTDGKFYFSAYEELGEYGTEKSGMFIVELDLKTGECRKITEEEDYENYSINKIEIFGGALYYTYTAYRPEYFEMQTEIETQEDVIKLETYRDIWVRKVDLDNLENIEFSDGENFERYELKGVSGEYLILIDNIDSEIIAVNRDGKKKVLAVLGQFDWMYNVIFGEYVGYQSGGKDIYIHVETGEKFERIIKNIGTVFLYNEELDAVCVMEDYNKCIYHIIKVDDYIVGNY